MAAALLLLLSGCAAVEETTTEFSFPPLPGSPTTPQPASPPALNPDMIAKGADLYGEYCAACHGPDLEGDPDWKAPNEDGSYRPPPQDSSGHTWHHGDDLLVEIILQGSEFPQSRMPAFGDRLSEDEVLAILEFFKSRWGQQERAVQWEVTLRERAQS